MKKNIKKLSILISILMSSGFSNIALAEETAIPKESVPSTSSSQVEETVVETITLNNGLRGLIESQKDARQLLSDPNLSVDATLGELSKYTALTAIQDAKNKLEETASKGVDFQTTENVDAKSVTTIVNGKPIATNQKEKEEINVEEQIPEPDIKATAVYTLGNIGYAEIMYNGSKSVVKKGDKLPNGEVIESLSPLGIVIKSGDNKKTLPIVSIDSVSKPDYTLTAPRMQ